MNLTIEQEQAIRAGQAVMFDRADELDYNPWTKQEINLLASETADLVVGDGFDEPDDS